MAPLTFLLNFLNRPFRVLICSVCIGMVYLLYDGSFWNLWSLRRNHTEMEKRISSIRDEVKDLQFKVEEAKGRPFIERQATEQLGLVREDDLIIVFSDGE